MQVQSVTVTVEFTHSLGNYSAIKPILSASVLLQEDDDYSAVLDEFKEVLLDKIHLIVLRGIEDHQGRLRGPSEKPF